MGSLPGVVGAFRGGASAVRPPSLQGAALGGQAADNWTL